MEEVEESTAGFTEDELLKLEKHAQFPDETVRIKVARVHYVITVISQTYKEQET